MAKDKTRKRSRQSKGKAKLPSIDEFMKSGFEENSDDEAPILSSKKKPKQEVNSGSDSGKEFEDVDDDASDIEFGSEDDSDDDSKEDEALRNENESESEKNASNSGDENSDSDLEDPKQFKEAMQRLQSKDPEFYKYLAENDAKLLNFEVSDDDSDQSEEEEKVHKPDGKLKVDSDDSDFSEDENEGESKGKRLSGGRIKVTSSLISSWSKQLEESPDIETIRCVIQAFHSACEQASDSKSPNTKYVVEGNTVFNGTVRLCLVGLIPAIHKVLKLPPPTVPKTDKQGIDPSKSKHWPKLLVALKAYLTDVVKMMSVVSESEIVTLLLRHVLYLVPFFLHFLKHARLLLKKLVNFWCTSEETVRVLSFLGIIRLVRTMPREYLDYILKQMYMAYVKNCKFTSPSTWPMINFMKRSLVELYCLDHSVAYQHSFLYIRQLAIHLRNALATKNKDAFQTVYNWQYIHCVLLWSHLLSESRKSDLTKPLVYPLVQIALGTIKLIRTAKFFPLRFHILRSLTTLSEETGTFIPVLPLLLEVLNAVNIGKKHSSLSMKPLNLSCILKVSKSQQNESGFKDACVEHVFELFMDYTHVYSHTIGFPELVLPAIIQLKSFVKKCKVANYCKQMKQLLEKLDENSSFIINKRKNVSFGVSEMDKVYEWESQCKASGTPIDTFYVSWRKMKDRTMLQSIAGKSNSSNDELEKLKQMKDDEKLRTANKEEREEFKELFTKDDSDDDSSLFAE